LPGSEKASDEKELTFLRLTFQPPLKDFPAELVGKTLKPEELPFKVNWPAVEAFWLNSGEDLKIRLKLDNYAFYAALAQNPLILTWPETMLVKPRIDHSGPIYGAWSELGSLTVQPNSEDKFLKPQPTIIGPPKNQALLEASLVTYRDIPSLVLSVHFSSPMVKPEQARGPQMVAAESPSRATLWPDYGWRAEWLSPWNLRLTLPNLRPEAFASKIVGQLFGLAFDQNFVGPLGHKPQDFKDVFLVKADSQGAMLGQETNWRPAETPWTSPPTEPNLKGLGVGFYFDLFRAVSFTQVGFTEEGKTIFELIFNKPVKIEELKKALTIATLPRRTQEYLNAPFELSLEKGDLVALATLSAPNGAEIKAEVKNLTSADGQETIALRSFKSRLNNQFTVTSAKLDREPNYPWASFFVINVDDALPDVDLTPYIRLEPPLPFTVEWNESLREMKIKADFPWDAGTKIILAKGLKSENGVLNEPLEFLAKFEGEPRPKIAFTGLGRYLSPKKPLLVQVAGREADVLRVQAWRVYENNLPFLLSATPILRPSSKAQLSLRMSKNVLDFEVRLDETSFTRLLDFGGLFKEPLGSYVIKVTPLNESKAKDSSAGSSLNSPTSGSRYQEPAFDYYDFIHNPEFYLPVALTDLSLAARVYPSNLAVWVSSIATSSPVPRTLVRFYDEASQVIFEGRANAEGLVFGQVDPESVAFVTAQNGSDLSYLLLPKNSRQTFAAGYNPDWQESYDHKWLDGSAGYTIEESYEGKEYLTKGYEGIFILPRDIWKPGETVMAKAIIRDKAQSVPKEPFPLIWRVLDPDERVLEEGRAMVSQTGSLDFSTVLPFSARTGPYRLKLLVPGQAASLVEGSFTVDDFVPPRLDIALKPDQSQYFGLEPQITLTGEAKYLFGAPGSDLDWELKVMGSTGQVTAPGFEDYDLNGPETSSGWKTMVETSGALGEEGLLTETFKPDYVDPLPHEVRLRASWSVTADSGRAEGQTANFIWRPRQILVGFKAPTKALVNQPISYGLAAVTALGQPSETPSLAVTVSKIQYRYFSESRYGRVYRQRSEELLEVFSGNVPLQEGRGLLELTLSEPGLYQIAASPASSSAEELAGEELAPVTRRFKVEGLAEADQSVIAQEPAPEDTVELTLDKQSYKTGESAQVLIKAPFDGTLWLGLETDKPLWHKVISLKNQTATIKLPIPKEVVNNAHLTAALARPVGPNGPFLALGRVSLEMDRSPRRLTVKVDEPERLKPSQETPIKIHLANSQGRPQAGEVTVALVDEGILSLTNYEIPDPSRFFGQSRRLASFFHHGRDLLLPILERNWPFLAPGGGDERGGLFSPFQRRQETLSIFLATIPIGPSGVGEALLKLPEYSGQGRLSVVASADNQFGLYNQSFRISRDLVIEPSLPLALAPGDQFVATIRVYLDPEAEKTKAKLALNFLGPLSVVEAPGFVDNQMTLDLTPGQSETLRLTLKATSAEGDPVGPAELLVTGTVGEESFVQPATTVVRPPFPRVTRVTSRPVTSTKEEIIPDLKGFWPGTIMGSLSLAAGPWVEANRAKDYLSNYPHGCLEQTVSKAWLFLTAADFGTLSQAEEIEVTNGLNAAIKRLATTQTHQGSLAMWPGGTEPYEWGTAYAAHFLTEAKERVNLPPDLLEDVLGYFRNYLANDYSYDEGVAYLMATKAYALYVLALNGDYQDGWINALLERANVLPTSAKIFLSGAIALKEGHPRALLELENAGFDLSLSDLASARSSLESQARNEALLLLVWGNVDPLSTKTRDLAERVAKSGANNRWRSTQENAMALLALANYLKKTQVTEPYVATLSSAGKALGQGANSEMTTFKGPDFIQALNGPLTLEIEGQGRPWRNLLVSGVPTEPPAPLAVGLSLEKRWLAPAWEVLISETAQDLKVFKGQKIKVSLKLNSTVEAQNVVIMDLAPGGLEIVSPGENSYGSRAEIREDRLVLIIPRLTPGSYSFEYELRAVTEGEFVLPPTSAEGMYEPDKRAMTVTGRVRVVPKENEESDKLSDLAAREKAKEEDR
jgi:uncharacterized protein YfaS (alpha-2-macroglobulin family)